MLETQALKTSKYFFFFFFFLKIPETGRVKLMSANTGKLARKWIIKHIVFFLTADIVTIDLNQTKQIHRSIIVIINVCTSRHNMRYRTL